MQILSAGAAQTVTGSCHLITINDKNILLDCGMFQGPAHMAVMNREGFPFEVADIDAVVLSHGHLDHIGRLPLLLKNGYRGPIYCDPATRDILTINLKDSAKIQAEDYGREMRRAKRSGREHTVPEPLYTEHDVGRTLEHLRPVLTYDETLKLDGVSVRFAPAGHILGSGWIELDSQEGRVVFSGDLGNRESGVQDDAALPRGCDAVIVETTYANRRHRDLQQTLSEFRNVIREAVASGGNVMIPSFALERTQNILYYLNTMIDGGELPPLQIFLDSPMATKLTRLYQEGSEAFLPEVTRALNAGEQPFEPETLTYTVTSEASKAINEIESGAIIIAGSGMMTGGRILHHLKHNLWRREASLVVVGYQAHGTLGRRLVDGAKRVRIMGSDIKVRASIDTINGFSAHADRDDLLAWLDPTEDAHIYMVHGEVEVMDAFKETLHQHDRDATQLVWGQSYVL